MVSIAPAIDLNFWDSKLLTDPYQGYALLLEKYPVCRFNNNGIFGVSRYEDVYAALRNEHLFSGGSAADPRSEWLPDDCKHEIFLIADSNPLHGKRRKLVNKSFTPMAISDYKPAIGEEIDRRLSSIIPNISLDFLTQFSYPFSSTVLSMTTGIDDDDKKRSEVIRRWSYLTEKNEPHSSIEHKHETIKATRELNAIYSEILADRIQNPDSKNDLISLLLSAEVDGKPLEYSTICAALNLFLSAGFMTTAQFLAVAMIELSKSPELFSTLKSDQSLIPAFIEELLRFSGPTHSVLRSVAEPVQIQGYLIPKGSVVRLFIAAADRDPRQFEDPNEFRLNRPNIKTHVAFGHGIHVCIGAALVRFETRIVLERLLTEFEAIECPDNDHLQWTSTLFTRGLDSLPITFKK